MSVARRVMKFAAKSIGEQAFIAVGSAVGAAIGDLIAKKINPDYRDAIQVGVSEEESSQAKSNTHRNISKTNIK